MNYKDKFVGIVLYGYCEGLFRNCYDDKTIIASGENWIVVKDELDEVKFATFDENENMEELIKDWSKRDN